MLTISKKKLKDGNENIYDKKYLLLYNRETMLNEIHNSIMSLNSSAYFSGIVMLMLNIGSKYITIELSKTQEQFLRNKIARQMLIFSIIWLGMRDIYKSLILTAVFVLLTDHLFNENSNLCVLPKKMQLIKNEVDVNDDNELSDVEVSNAVMILEKAKKRTQQKNKLSALNNFMT